MRIRSSTDRLAKLRDVDLQCLARRLGRALAPEGVRRARPSRRHGSGSARASRERLAAWRHPTSRTRPSSTTSSGPRIRNSTRFATLSPSSPAGDKARFARALPRVTPLLRPGGRLFLHSDRTGRSDERGGRTMTTKITLVAAVAAAVLAVGLPTALADPAPAPSQDTHDRASAAVDLSGRTPCRTSTHSSVPPRRRRRRPAADRFEPRQALSPPGPRATNRYRRRRRTSCGRTPTSRLRHRRSSSTIGIGYRRSGSDSARMLLRLRSPAGSRPRDGHEADETMAVVSRH